MYALVSCLALQVLVFFLQVSFIGTSRPYALHSSSTALTHSLEQFRGYSSSSEQGKDGKVDEPSDGKDKASEPIATKRNDTDIVASTLLTNKSIDVSSAQEDALSNATLNIQTHKDTESNIPDWLKEYIAWHRHQRKDLTLQNWNKDNRKYLIMQCLESDNRCGGTADRLKPIPTLLLLAHQFQRILLIRWERPCKLDEFLQPTPTGLDWRVPDWLAPHLGSMPIGATTRKLRFHLKTNHGNDVVVRSRYQSDNGGADYYNEVFNSTIGGGTFADIYHNVWHTIFQPVPPLQQRIDDAMQSLSLHPGEYAAAHLRALYAVSSRPPRLIRNAALNAVNCASQLRPGGPIFFAADSKLAVEIVQQYAESHSKSIVAANRKEEPLHLEKANHTFRQASEYYDTFVDLYLLGSSRCLAYNVGGFGTWALFMGYNSSCSVEHATRNLQKLTKCKWADAPS